MVVSFMKSFLYDRNCFNYVIWNNIYFSDNNPLNPIFIPIGEGSNMHTCISLS